MIWNLKWAFYFCHPSIESMENRIFSDWLFDQQFSILSIELKSFCALTRKPSTTETDVTSNKDIERTVEHKGDTKLSTNTNASWLGVCVPFEANGARLYGANQVKMNVRNRGVFVCECAFARISCTCHASSVICGLEWNKPFHNVAYKRETLARRRHF